MSVNDSLAIVRGLLRDWVRYRRGWRPDNGYPHAVAWIDQVKGHFDSWTEDEDYDIRIRQAQMRHVDEAVAGLPSECRHAIAVVYLNEAGPAVWRSARKPMGEIRELCSRAEAMLIPLLRRRDVL
jgi:hypothetical protein